MDFISMTLAIAKPNGMWENIITWLNSSVGNYALAIIILTICIKLIMLPLDIFQRYITKANSRKQAVIQPQLEALKRKYANSPDTLNQKTMELYKKENMSMTGTCVGLLANMVVSMVIFFTLFASLNTMATYKIDQEYRTLETTYTQVYDSTMTEGNKSEGDEGYTELQAKAISNGQQAVLVKYDEVKNSFLWIKNVWIADSSSKAVFTYDEFLSKTSQSKDDVNETTYNNVMKLISEKYGNDWNGYYILVVMSAVITFLSLQMNTWISKIRAKRRGTVFVDPNGSNKIMMYVMPVIMAVFTLFYNAVFAIYIVAGSVFSLVTSPLITILVEKLDERKVNKNDQKKIDKTRPKYSRENLF